MNKLILFLREESDLISKLCLNFVEVPVSEAGHVGDQHLAGDVAARDEETRRNPRFPAGPSCV